MAKKKKHEEHENLERWLVSYADFMTLLFATFVVLYALSQLDLAKFKDLKISLAQAFNPSLIKGNQSLLQDDGKSILNKEAETKNDIFPSFNPNMEKKKMKEAEENLNKAIKEGKMEGVSAKVDKRGLVISLVDSVFFDSGSAIIKNNAKGILNKVALTLKKDFENNNIRIEGHTDNDPIRTSIYPSNWELSGARASSVVRMFIKDFKMNKQSFSAVGYADAKPLDANNTLEGKKRNRRVEIVILNSTKNDNTSTEGTDSSPDVSPATKEPVIETITGGKNIADINDTSEIKQEETQNNESDAQVFEPINKNEMPIKKKETAQNTGQEIQEVERETFQ